VRIWKLLIVYLCLLIAVIFTRCPQAQVVVKKIVPAPIAKKITVPKPPALPKKKKPPQEPLPRGLQEIMDEINRVLRARE